MKGQVNGTSQPMRLADCLVEVTQGIGDQWKQFPVLGATRNGLAPAKEAVGKNPHRYKPVEPGTVFYNPMYLAGVDCNGGRRRARRYYKP